MQENLLKITLKNFYIVGIISIFFCTSATSKESWIIDKSISSITFEVPVLLATNVLGEFEDFDGLVEIDVENNRNNKAILSVEIDSIQINYNKYRDLILSPIFFDLKKYPLCVIDTKKFSYANESELVLDIELSIKGISKKVKTELKVIKLTKNMVQILGELEFNRNDFNIGTGNWKNTSILKNQIKINANIFLIKE